MKSEHAWALLTARAIQYGKVPGGHAAMSQADIAALLAGLARRPYLTAMLADVGDTTVHHELYMLVRESVISVAIDERWKLARPKICEQLALLAIFELVGARDPCGVCEGSGSVPIEEGSPTLVPCEVCLGTGRAPLTGRDRASLLEIHESNWNRTWAPRYEGVFVQLHYWLADARRHMARKLRKEARSAA